MEAVDYRDKLAKIIASQCEDQALSLKDWCRINSFHKPTLDNIISKRRNVTFEMLDRLLSVLGFEMEFKQVSDLPEFAPPKRPGPPKYHEGVSYPRRLKGRPKGRKDSAPRRRKV